jgi:hypothetical protein
MISIFNIVKIARKAGCAGFALGFITLLSPERYQDALSSTGGGTTGDADAAAISL